MSGTGIDHNLHRDERGDQIIHGGVSTSKISTINPGIVPSLIGAREGHQLSSCSVWKSTGAREYEVH